MKEKAKAFVEQNPFWTGIIAGFLICFALIGLLSGIGAEQTNSFKNADQILKEDYLRMTVEDYAFTKNADRAKWRYKQLGEEAPSLIALLKKDDLTDPLALFEFSRVVGDMTLFYEGSEIVPEQTNQPVSQEESGGVSLIGKILILLILLILVGAIVLFLVSNKSSSVKEKTSRFFARFQNKNEPSWKVKTDDQFDLGKEIKGHPIGSRETKEDEDLYKKADRILTNEFELSDAWVEDETGEENDEINSSDTSETLIQTKPRSDAPEESDVLDEDGFKNVNITQKEGEESPETEENLGNSEDHLSGSEFFDEDGFDSELESFEDLQPEDVISEKPDKEVQIPDTEPDIHPEEKNIGSDFSFKPESGRKNVTSETISKEDLSSEDEPLIHYQTIYKLGDDFFDETFSLDEGDKFIGECGIGIAETINNTDPKAVTAFEIWLFDREDSQTPTHFLLSDYAYNNDELLERLKNKGRFDLIERNRDYEVKTQNLRMIVTIKDMEYGTESSDKKSYFNKVTFDVQVWNI